MSHSIAGKNASDAGSEADPASNAQLIDLASGFAKETSGLRKDLVSQFAEILKTGGSQATVPIISKAVEASKQATSNTLKQLDEQLTTQKLAGTPFGAMVKAQTAQAGNQATSQVPTGIAQAFLQMIPNYILGQSQTATQGLGVGAQNQTSLANTGLQGFYKSVNLGK